MDSQWAVSGYSHVRELGEGSAGRVVLALHDDTDTPVAIKYLSPRLYEDGDFADRFETEAQLLAGVKDPHVVRFLQYVQTPDGNAVVTELINGVGLAALIGSEGPIRPEAALAILKGALRGLTAAHIAGVVHRDHKPGNILIRGDGLSKLTDFGLAVRASADAPAPGTPAYMAPELWDGGPATRATDLYAATAVFHESLTGARPFPAKALPKLAEAHRSGQIPLNRIPAPLRHLISHGMAKRPEDRPASGGEFLAELEAVALAEYGTDWHERGLKHLAQQAGLLAIHTPTPRPNEQREAGQQAEEAPSAASPLALTEPFQHAWDRQQAAAATAQTPATAQASGPAQASAPKQASAPAQASGTAPAEPDAATGPAMAAAPGTPAQPDRPRPETRQDPVVPAAAAADETAPVTRIQQLAQVEHRTHGIEAPPVPPGPGQHDAHNPQEQHDRPAPGGFGAVRREDLAAQHHRQGPLPLAEMFQPPSYGDDGGPGAMDPAYGEGDGQEHGKDKGGRRNGLIAVAAAALLVLVIGGGVAAFAGGSGHRQHNTTVAASSQPSNPSAATPGDPGTPLAGPMPSDRTHASTSGAPVTSSTQQPTPGVTPPAGASSGPHGGGPGSGTPPQAGNPGTPQSTKVTGLSIGSWARADTTTGTGKITVTASGTGSIQVAITYTSGNSKVSTETRGLSGSKSYSFSVSNTFGSDCEDWGIKVTTGGITRTAKIAAAQCTTPPAGGTATP
ncbi:MAG: serine/threonine protein kinase [Streptosporangiaceae bacterium]|nr:serine/threonine protein kinase [Streptosporangiaceae bacterium]